MILTPCDYEKHSKEQHIVKKAYLFCKLEDFACEHKKPSVVGQGIPVCAQCKREVTGFSLCDPTNRYIDEILFQHGFRDFLLSKKVGAESFENKLFIHSKLEGKYRIGFIFSPISQ